jgi:hypothetical protein
MRNWFPSSLQSIQYQWKVSATNNLSINWFYQWIKARLSLPSILLLHNTKQKLIERSLLEDIKQVKVILNIPNGRLLSVGPPIGP